MASPDDFQTRSDTFMQWLRSLPSATVSPKIALADLRSSGAGRGVVAQAPLAQNEELFSVPRSSVISVENSELSTKIPDVFQDLDPWLGLVLVLLYEYLRGSGSQWKPYFDILPDDFNTLIFWSDQELRELQASAVVNKIGKKTADGKFHERLWPVVQSHPELFSPAPSLNMFGSSVIDEMTMLTLAHRMASVIMAYAFDIEKIPEVSKVDDEGFISDDEDEDLPKGLVPMADMLNADADRNNARLFYETSFLTMKTLRPIEAGEELFNDYGLLPRSDMLRRYGYITDNYLPFDVVEVPSTLLIKCASDEGELDPQDIQRRTEYLDHQGILEDGYDLSHPTDGSDSFPPELLSIIKLFLMSEAEFQKMRDRQSLPKPAMTSQVSRVLRTVVSDRMQQYSTKIAADKDCLMTPDLSRRKREAIEVRLGEKIILQEIIDLLDSGDTPTAAGLKRGGAQLELDQKKVRK